MTAIASPILSPPYHRFQPSGGRYLLPLLRTSPTDNFIGLMNLFKFVRLLFQHDLNADDLVVFVVGPSGGGKSWFINTAAKSHLLGVSDKLEPYTKDVGAVRCELTNEAKKTLKLDASARKSVVFVDMPSFHTGLGNDAQKKVTKWLKNLKYASTLVGTIYVARVESNPADKPTEIQDHLNTFARTFPQDVKNPPNRLVAVLSYESKLSPNKISCHMEQFENQVNAINASVMEGGKRRLAWQATFYREHFREDPRDHALSRNIAWKVVEELFSGSISSPQQS